MNGICFFSFRLKLFFIVVANLMHFMGSKWYIHVVVCLVFQFPSLLLFIFVISTVHHMDLMTEKLYVLLFLQNYENFTRIINDFSLLPPEPKEGRMEYLYHEDTQAFFDDVDHYKMIKAMCRLSCSVCDKEESNDGSKHRGKFRNINQLKGHLFHQHKLHMCSLCLEGRKVRSSCTWSCMTYVFLFEMTGY